MSEKIDIKRKVFGKNSFQNVVDISFKQFVISDPNINISSDISVTDFFQQYDSIFYSIPPSGSNSHLELVNRSSEYLGISFIDLQEEIRQLREENVSLKNQLLNTTNQSL